MKSLFLYSYRSLKYNAAFKLFALISIFGLSYFLWSVKYSNEKFTKLTHKEIFEKLSRDDSYNDKYAEDNLKNETERQPKDIKYILLWMPRGYPSEILDKGQLEFIRNNCSMTNCYVTSDRQFFGESTIKFNAIIFTGKIFKFSKRNLPQTRWPHQKYIYLNMESADNYPICNDNLNDYFNWTATYKFDSDILYNYILIKDKSGQTVGPRQNMKWVETKDKLDDDLVEVLRKKTKAAAWFVSHCETNSKREQFVSKLQKALNIFDLSLDIYGDCGPFKCPRDRKDSCLSMIEKDYYFYMSLENSFAEDYVTEKLLFAVQHNTVPIVLGGANYSRFLPPGSYLDGSKYVNSPIELAEYMHCLIRSPKSYQQFFKWKRQYTYYDAGNQNVCSLCEAMNDRLKYDTVSIYHDFKKWWNDHDQPAKCAPGWFFG